MDGLGCRHTATPAVVAALASSAATGLCVQSLLSGACFYLEPDSTMQQQSQRQA